MTVHGWVVFGLLLAVLLLPGPVDAWFVRCDRRTAAGNSSPSGAGKPRA